MVNDGTLDALLTLTLKDCDRSSKFDVLPQFTVGDLSSSPSDKKHLFPIWSKSESVMQICS
jgi:hypothetical protein